MEEEVAKTGHRSLLFRVKRKISHTLGSFIVTSYRTLRAQPFLMDTGNRKSRELYQKTVHTLSDVQGRAVESLERDGIFITSTTELFGDDARLEQIRETVTKEFAKAELGRNKKFLVYLWNNRPTFDVESPVVKLGLSPSILEIGNAYLNLFVRFVFYSVNKTVVLKHDEEAAGSQRWHRDPPLGDERILKVFLYLTDVDETSGPFMYVKGSHRSGRLGHFFRTKQPYGIYPDAGTVEAEPQLLKEIIACTGKAGTVVFCDTTGLHKGGFSTKKERDMVTLEYVSPASLQKPSWILPAGYHNHIKKLSLLERQALGYV